MHPSVFHSQWTNVYMYSLDFHRSAFIFFMFGAPMTPPQDTTRPSSQHLGESMFKKVQNTRQEGGGEKSVRNRPANPIVSRRRRKKEGGEGEKEEEEKDEDKDEDEEEDENEDEEEDKDKKEEED